MASLPPADCCIRGIHHEGTPVGTFAPIGEINTYFARPSGPPSTTAILLFSDVFGLYQNVELIADAFAARGYLTVVPDLFAGDAIPVGALDGGDFDLPAWLAKHPMAAIDAVGAAVIAHLKTVEGVRDLAGVGYCFGGKYVVRNLQAGILRAGFIAHPSFVTMEELGAITQPLSIAAAEIDTIFTKDLRYASETLLAAKDVPYQISLYGAVSHGFAVRGDLDDKRSKFAIDQAFQQALSWFAAWL